MIMYNKRISLLTLVVIICTFFLINAIEHKAYATINNAYGIKYASNGTVFCPVSSTSGGVPRIDSGSYFKIGSCTLTAQGYVPVSGQYRLGVSISIAPETYAISNPTYIDAKKDISYQTLNFSGSNVNISGTSSYSVHYCYTLLDQNNNMWSIINGGGCSGGLQPLPPTPKPPTINCTINNSNAINVNLGNLDRALLPTVPGTGQPQTVKIPVSCVTDTASVTTLKVNMKLTYTPITVSGLQVIKSSTNGMGVSVIYNNNVLAPSVDKPIDFYIGSNNISLGFEAVRDPNIEVAKVPTGAFTASAVLVMTVQ